MCALPLQSQTRQQSCNVDPPTSKRMTMPSLYRICSNITRRSGHSCFFHPHPILLHKMEPLTPATPSSPGLLGLPIELLIHVVELSISPDDIFASSSHLARLARTCKELNTVALDVLYKSPVIKNFKDLGGYISAIRKHGNLARKPNSLVGLPDIFKWLRVFDKATLRFSDPISRHLSESIRRHLSDHLGRHVQFPEPSSITAFLMTLPGLRSITLPSDVPLLYNQPKVSSVKNITIFDIMGPHPHRLVSRWSLLGQREPKRCSKGWNLAVLVNMTTELESLSCGGAEAQWVDDMWTKRLQKAVFKHIATLRRLKVFGEDQPHDNTENARRPRTTFAGFQCLKELHINYSILAAINYGQPDSTTLVPLRLLLPDRLQKLTLHVTCIWPNATTDLDRANKSGLLVDVDYTGSLISALSLPSLSTFHLHVDFYRPAKGMFFFCNLPKLEQAAAAAKVVLTFCIVEKFESTCSKTGNSRDNKANSARRFRCSRYT